MSGISTLAPRARRRMQPPAPADPVTQYALDVVAGRVVAGVLVHKACERHLRDLATGRERGIWFDASAARKAIAFFPLLRHYKGEWGPRPGKPLGDPIVLEPWQKFVVGSAFGWKHEDGLRRFREVYLEVARKNGKTLMAAGLAIMLAFFDGEPGAEIYAVATKREQAKIAWNDARRMVAKNPSLAARIQTFSLSLVDQATASFFRPLGRDSGERDIGTNPYGAIIDELHVLEERESIDSMETGVSARRQPMIIKITTAGKNRQSVWSEERADAIAVVEGRATDDSMLVLVYTLDEGDDPFDEAVWPKANPNLGISVKLDGLREQADRARRAPGRLAAYLQLRMNVPTQQSTRAIDMGAWDACDGRLRDENGAIAESYDEWVARTIPKGAVGYEGLDLASVQDLTALVALFPAEDGRYNAFCRFWCPQEGILERSRADGVPYADWARDGFLVATPGKVTDYAFVRAEQQALAGHYEIADIGFDRWNATQLATELQQDGATCTIVPQSHAGLGPGWRELERIILEGKLAHGGHPILRWMAGNVEVETDAAGNQKPSKARSTERIDGIVALDMAMGRAIVAPLVAEAEPFILFGSGR